MSVKFSRKFSRSTPIHVAFAAMAVLFGATPSVLAQGFPQQGPASFPPSGSPPASANPVCQRLEAQLASLSRGGSDPARADQQRRYEDAAAKQQGELDRVTNQAKRMGCDSSGFFSLFSAQNAQCGPVNAQIQQMRGNLDQINANLEKLRGTQNSDQDIQVRSVTQALAQNNCGPQYAAAARAQGGGFLDNLFNPGTSNPDLGAPSSTYRTVCVRTCDGYYFPVSFATVPSRFADDEKTCKSLCPAADASLFTYRNPGEDINSAVSINGQPYSQLQNAFKYRQEFSPTCSCRAAGQSWGEALKSIDDSANVQQGDIVVTEESAKQMQQRDAQGRPIRPPAAKGAAKGGPAAAASTAPAATTSSTTPPVNTTPPGDRPIRTVGPTFLPNTKQ